MNHKVQTCLFVIAHQSLQGTPTELSCMYDIVLLLLLCDWHRESKNGQSKCRIAWIAACPLVYVSCTACWFARYHILLQSCNHILQEQSNKAESLVRLYDSIANAAEALGRLAGEELQGAQAEHLEEEAAAKVCKRALPITDMLKQWIAWSPMLCAAYMHGSLVM